VQAYTQILGTPVPGDPFGRTYAERIAQRVAEVAMRGNPWAVAEIGDRTEGKPRQAFALSGPDGKPIQVASDLMLSGLSDEDLDRMIANLIAAGSTQDGAGAAAETELTGDQLVAAGQ
jgi:hypothetical protein